MLGLGLASSHAPAMFCPPEAWPIVYDAIPDYMKDSQPHTAKLETPDVIRAQIARTDKAFEVLRDELARFEPDAIVFIGAAQGLQAHAWARRGAASTTWPRTMPRSASAWRSGRGTRRNRVLDPKDGR